MVQHLLFTLIAAAAVDRGDAGVAPPPVPPAPTPVATAFGFLTKPLVALILFNSALLFVHWPAVVSSPYDPSGRTSDCTCCWSRPRS